MNSTHINKNLNYPLNLREMENFELVYKTYYHPLKLFIGRALPKDDAEDLVGDFFFRLWKKKSSFESEAHLQGYLYQSANNAMLDFLKSHRITKTEPLALQDLHEFENYRVDIIKAEVYGELYRSINTLPLQCRRVISLSALEGMNNKEIAQHLGISEQTVKNTKTRAIQMLKKNMGTSPLLIILLSAK